ncbi:MAG: ferritin-like domain-containing protein [Thermoplasmata archaeon]
MGRKGTEIVGAKASDIIQRLNQAVAAEALDAYRYLYLSKWAAGLNAPEVAELFYEISEHEWGHLGTFMERIIELGGRPIARTSDFEKYAYTTYMEPPRDKTDIRKMVEDSLVGERKAIEFYQELVDLCKESDPVTYMMALEALADEVRDEENLEDFLE